MLEKLIIHIVSDSTGDTAATIVYAVGVQFHKTKIYVRRHYNIRTEAQVDVVIAQIRREPGLVVFTMANSELSHYMLRSCTTSNLVAVDLLGPLFKALSQHYNVDRDERMGAFHAVNESYFQRIEAIEYTLQHDDSQSVRNLKEADVILVGVSRTSKTPVSMYLAIQRGYKVANVAFALGVDPPPELFEVPPSKVVGLTISPERLVDIRRSRLGKMAFNHNSQYADEAFVFEELEMAEKIFRKNPLWPVIDVSDRSIEETATLVMDKIFGRVRLMKRN